jgi:hypothetical protein
MAYDPCAADAAGQRRPCSSLVDIGTAATSRRHSSAVFLLMGMSCRNFEGWRRPGKSQGLGLQASRQHGPAGRSRAHPDRLAFEEQMLQQVRAALPGFC